MAITKKIYEISVWDETLGEKGSKEETKRAIIGAHDMTYEGRAKNVKLQKKLNGTNVLTFSMPSSFFDSKQGKMVHNEFCDYLFNERKLKLKYKVNDRNKVEWLEFYIKNIVENKQHKSIMYNYTCQDSFIDELSRNGYGITFDTELYNNVEEIGTFSEIILEDSIWEYDASMNIGDFTEFSEEMLFKIPISHFTNSIVSGYRINFYNEQTAKDFIITNPFTQETRPMSISDDYARQNQYFWDNHEQDKGFPLLANKIENIENDGYIYVPYNQLDFCYVIQDGKNGFTATETAVSGELHGCASYYLAPSSLNPESLIQFIAIPKGADVRIDEAQLLQNTNYSYVMKLSEWNNLINNNLWYKFETKSKDEQKAISEEEFDSTQGNKIVTYDGYLDNINGIEINTGKSITISDRTEINISEEVDQYVKVYNNKSEEYKDLYTSSQWVGNYEGYRVCSKQDTRQIIPQLAKNLIENGTNISTIDGWAKMCPNGQAASHEGNDVLLDININIGNDKSNNENEQIVASYLHIIKDSNLPTEQSDAYSIINFGIVGQEKEIIQNKIYCLRVKAQVDSNNVLPIYIETGGLNAIGDYFIQSHNYCINLSPNEQLIDTYLLVSFDKNIKTPYLVIDCSSFSDVKIYEVQLFEAYTKGQDFFGLSVGNKGGQRIYRYSGRELTGVDFTSSSENARIKIRDITTTKDENNRTRLSFEDILFETDVMEGETYEYTRYFIQQLQLKNNERQCYDTFLCKQYTSDNIKSDNKDDDLTTLPLPSSKYTEDDYEIITNYIDLNKCPHYCFENLNQKTECECSGNICLYQRYGYCPYLFQTEKHCRKIRTLNGEKSNRFNLTQELGKVFEVYPIYYINHHENGKIITTSDNKMEKKVFYMTEKGSENKLGFRYQKNLSNISRTRDSSQIVTKLYVEDVDSQLSKTGLCSIKTAEDNPSKDSFVIDFSYYYLNGMLDKEMTEYDLYGKNDNDMGYLKQLGFYNTEYDKLSNQIINLQDEAYTELEANIEVNLTGMDTAMQEMNKTKVKMNKYRPAGDAKPSQTYINYQETYKEQQGILLTLLKDTFTDGQTGYIITKNNDGQIIMENVNNMDVLLEKFTNNKLTIQEMKDYIYTYHPKPIMNNEINTNIGLLAQYLTIYGQIQELKKIRSSYLESINKISLAFYQKYEPYLKEGTWSDGNYLTDNAYYHGAAEVAKQGAIPKYTYTISAIDLGVLDVDYIVNIGDTSYVEDIEIFGTNKKTGLPNRLKVIISGITYDLDVPSNNSLEIQNYTTQFEDLFQQVSASVQSLSFNENIYKRSSNFTSTQNIAKDSLQGTLLKEDVTLLKTQENNIVLDSMGQSGSDINNHNNKYKLNGQGLFFSNDGGQHWNTGVGPSGINADYIKVGTLDAGKIKIVDNNYLYFLWDKDGIIAYREPSDKNGPIQSLDYCQFNKYGLSLFEDGTIKLRAGYEIVTDGNTNKILLEQQGKRIGFFLYDKLLNTIFSATNEDNYSARISLGGEMFVTNKLVSQINTYTYSNSIGEGKEYSFKYFDLNKTNSVLAELNLQNNKNDIIDIINNMNNSNQKEYSARINEQDVFFSISNIQNVAYVYNEGTDYIQKSTEVKIITNSQSGLISLYHGNLYAYDFFIKHWTVERRQNDLSDYNTIQNIEPQHEFLVLEQDGQYIKYNYETFWIQSLVSNNYTVYQNKNKDTSISQDDKAIGIFINNQAFSNGEHLRVFSCVLGSNTDDQETFSNLLTILNDGRLQIGGLLKGIKDGYYTKNTLNTIPDQVELISRQEEAGNTLIYDPSQGDIFLNEIPIGQFLTDLQNSVSDIGQSIEQINSILEQLNNFVTKGSYEFRDISITLKRTHGTIKLKNQTTDEEIDYEIIENDTSEISALSDFNLDFS